MADKSDLVEWVVEALKANGNQASVVTVSRFIWQHHERELRESGDLLYTWQYDVRWAATTLRKKKILLPADGGPWTLR